ncbi:MULTISPECIES: TetR/AcrR family transcriptional regulator [Novosphingobium]|uniref:TetR/AcrR family transcriptional regulator n=1 Tax=unclassified Novosphingobium TaxID=2644732 RepID=UPI0006CDB68E|nr:MULTISPECIES: TetR/AcrR family transcriptional regulator [unclassified Novosphingobium]KPH68161.1 transcriptional regulator [Novosphingobium sp. ST904]TCM23835.1 TetR family transcriptional regulator [Novosphingobium sp. ST904]WRT95222.1 helix-turn-helix domain-containing protein [Novosphingobium sp. RL4]
MTMTVKNKVRRTQEERTAQTRLALLEAAIEVIHDVGYAAANTSMISERAGVSRGAMLHHFGTRAALMADVVRHVFDSEMVEYERIRQSTGLGNRLGDWPKVLWQVLGRPSGLAVLEILQAARSDAHLETLVVPMQEEVEARALQVMQGAFGGDMTLARTVMRLMVWSVRGLTIAERHLPVCEENVAAVEMLSRLLELAAPDGSMENLPAVLARS